MYVTCLIVAQSLSIVAKASDKIAVVNISSIFQQSPERTVVARQLENEFEGRATELQFMERDLQSKMQHLQREGSIMKASERSSLEKSVIEQRKIFSNKAQVFEQDNHRRQTEERNKILYRIQDTVKNFAKKEGYDIVIDSNAVAYAKNAKDITDNILNQVK
ncbi:MAG: molecular chaperone Skp [Sodalis sp. (in: enterobacteria)]